VKGLASLGGVLCSTAFASCRENGSTLKAIYMRSERQEEPRYLYQ